MLQHDLCSRMQNVNAERLRIGGAYLFSIGKLWTAALVKRCTLLSVMLSRSKIQTRHQSSSTNGAPCSFHTSTLRSSHAQGPVTTSRDLPNIRRLWMTQRECSNPGVYLVPFPLRKSPALQIGKTESFFVELSRLKTRQSRQAPLGIF